MIHLIYLLNLKKKHKILKQCLMELIAETDDELLDKYFSGEELTKEDIQKGITIGIQNGDIIPVICGSTINNIGTDRNIKYNI